VKNVRRGQHFLFREHVTHFLATYLFSTVRANLTTEKTRTHMTGQHDERPRVGGGSLDVIIVTDVVQRHVLSVATPRVWKISIYFFSVD
jgi:hypothetical protein